MTEITRTARHEFRIMSWNQSHMGAPYHVEFRPLHPKTGKPWQASHRVTDGADVRPDNYTYPQAYSTFLLALEARDRKIAELTERYAAEEALRLKRASKSLDETKA